jgi:hypothetical protein
MRKHFATNQRQHAHGLTQVMAKLVDRLRKRTSANKHQWFRTQKQKAATTPNECMQRQANDMNDKKHA